MAKSSPLFGALERLAQSGALVPAAMGIFGGGGQAAKAAPAPEPIKPVPLPDLQDPEILAARRRLALSRAAGSGRAANVLRAQDDYSTDKTGVA